MASFCWVQGRGTAHGLSLGLTTAMAFGGAGVDKGQRNGGAGDRLDIGPDQSCRGNWRVMRFLENERAVRPDRSVSVA